MLTSPKLQLPHVFSPRTKQVCEPKHRTETSRSLPDAPPSRGLTLALHTAGCSTGPSTIQRLPEVQSFELGHDNMPCSSRYCALEPPCPRFHHRAAFPALCAQWAPSTRPMHTPHRSLSSLCSCKVPVLSPAPPPRIARQRSSRLSRGENSQTPRWRACHPCQRPRRGSRPSWRRRRLRP